MGKGNGLVGVIAGKDFGSPSPVLQLIDPLRNALSGIDVLCWNWNTPAIDRLIFGYPRIHFVPHSFAMQSVLFYCQEISHRNAKYVDDDPSDVELHVTSLDGVRWTTKDQVEQIRSFADFPLAQVVDQSPFVMPSAVKSWHAYWVPGGLVSSTIAPEDGVNFKNIPVHGVNHNTVINRCLDAVIARSREIFGV